MSNIKFSKTHEWIKFNEDGTAYVGISDHAQDALGDLVFINLPEVDTSYDEGDVFSDVESVKASSEIFMPVSGTVCEINEELVDAPELVNQDANKNWFVKITDISGGDDLMTEEEYESYLETAE